MWLHKKQFWWKYFNELGSTTHFDVGPRPVESVENFSSHLPGTDLQILKNCMQFPSFFSGKRQFEGIFIPAESFRYPISFFIFFRKKGQFWRDFYTNRKFHNLCGKYLVSIHFSVCIWWFTHLFGRRITLNWRQHMKGKRTQKKNTLMICENINL